MTLPAYMPDLDHAVWSDLHRRPWAITGRQYAALVRLSELDRWMRLTQRDLAAHLGYSLKGAHTFLASMRSGGLLAVRTRRGRLGGTWLRAVDGLLAALARGRPAPNVSPVDPRGAVLTVLRPETFIHRPSTLDPPDPGGPMEAWRALGAVLADLARPSKRNSAEA